MRELRFRGWHASTNKMFSAEEMAADQLTLLPTGRFINVNSVSTRLSEIYARDQFIPIQYTGLQDKKGIEIYEGDICLKYWNKEVYGDREPTKGVIKWVSFGARYTHESIEKFPVYCELHENLILNEYPRSMFEVIGNIYQQPYLLKID